jgi:transcriptional regulator with XRE-family HTH domain
MGEVTIDRGIGQQLERIRREQDLSVEQIAAGARDLGLAWSRNTVLGIERGKRGLNIAEFLLLPLVLDRSFERLGRSVPPISPGALLPDAKVDVGGVWVDGEVLRALLRGTRPPVGAIQIVPRQKEPLRRGRRQQEPELVAVRTMLPDDVEAAARIERASLGEAEMKLARTLGTLPELIVLASFDTWHRPISEERDARLEVLDVPDAPADKAQSRRRSLQALRGHITRELTEEFNDALRARRTEHLGAMSGQLRGGVAARLVREGEGEAERQLAGPENTVSEIVALAARDWFGRAASEELAVRIGSADPKDHETRKRAVRAMGEELAESVARIRVDLEQRKKLPARFLSVDDRGIGEGSLNLGPSTGGR